jgi:probable phosphoglycerate mutase
MGATEWTADGRHTGHEDVLVSEEGREQARRAGQLLAGWSFAHVLVSP